MPLQQKTIIFNFYSNINPGTFRNGVMETEQFNGTGCEMALCEVMGPIRGLGI